eukprot:903105_1
MDSIQRMGIDKKIKLLYQLTRDIGDKLHKKESKQEDIFIQFAHHLFDGTRYATDGTIPPNVIHGLGDVFRRYGHHLAELIEYHRQLDPDYFVLYLDKFLDFDECQSKLNENALYLREHFGISTKKWDRKIRKWYADIKKVAHAYIMSIENRKCNESKNFVDIDDFCVELVAQAKKAEEYFNRKVDWKILIMFIARFACMKANDTDISFKHWKVDDLQIIDDIEFENILYRHVQLYLH